RAGRALRMRPAGGRAHGRRAGPGGVALPDAIVYRLRGARLPRHVRQLRGPARRARFRHLPRGAGRLAPARPAVPAPAPARPPAPPAGWPPDARGRPAPRPRNRPRPRTPRSTAGAAPPPGERPARRDVALRRPPRVPATSGTVTGPITGWKPVPLLADRVLE